MGHQALILAGLFLVGGAAACGGSDTEGTGGSGGASTGTNGTGGSTSSSSSTSGTGGTAGTGGMAGTGGSMMCTADTQNDPMNCGSCGNQCAPGQTCVMGACTCGMSSVSFANDVQPILTASCATMFCHSGATPKGGLDMSAGKSYAALVGVLAGGCNDGRKRVEPGDPAVSYIVDKMMGVDLCVGKKMPPPPAMISTPEIQTISDWICGGALDN